MLNEAKYQFLIPNDEAEDIEEYSQALKNAFDNNNVKNIAISGIYGSGKSSFIKTFEKNNIQYKFLDISLATFTSRDAKENNQEVDLSLIEKSILEQIFYKVKNKTIPQSRLKKINRLQWLWLKASCIVVFILAYLIVFNQKTIEHILRACEFLLKIHNENITIKISVVVLLVGLFFIIKKILISLSNMNIEKLNLQNLELVANNESASLLNRYLDEILYFFERTNYDAVVFQDLDRFNNLEIFTKLRELNSFINNSEQVNKKIVFIYAIKDEMFKNANERTKFFDFIIPIIPYINATNSKDMFFKYFHDSIERKFIYDISLFIYDMRLVKNVYNEYLIYSKKLDEKLDETKLLAMIIYKNFEPNDFENLHKSKGLVYNIFYEEKAKYLETHINKLNEEILKIKEDIKKIENENLNDIKDLRRLYILKIIEKSNQTFNNFIYVKNKKFNIEDSLKDENFKLLIESDGIGTYDSYSGYLNIKFEDIEKDLSSYKDREKIIIDKAHNRKNTFLKNIKKLEDKKGQLKSMTIKELFENFSDINIFENINFENDKLMKYLLSYGYIGEDYENYISNFFGVSITKEERDFLLNIKNSGKALDFNYKLENLNDIVEHRLRLEEFKKESILNINLINFLFKNEDKYFKKIEAVFHKLSDESKISQDFILYCLDNCSQRDKFIKNIVKYYKNIWSFLADKKPDNLNVYFKWMICYANYEDIKNLNYDSYSLNNLTSMPSFNEDEIEKVIKLIEEMNLKFSQLNSIENDKIVEFIFKNYHYELNLDMVNKMIFYRCAYRGKVERDLEKAHFTTINSNKLTQDSGMLIHYILDNINEYVENVFLKIETNTKESEETIINLLNNKNLDINLKIKIIKKEETKISDIDNIDKTLWEDLFKLDKVKASWDNLFKYFNDKNTKNEFLIDFLNLKENAEEISKVRCGADYEEKHEFFTQDLLMFIIGSNDLDIKSYEYLIKNLGWCYSDLDLSRLNEEKISLLIRYNIISLEKDYFNYLKKNTKNLHIALVEKNIDKLLEKFDSLDFQTDDITKILQINDSILPKKLKENLIEKLDFNLISNGIIASLVYRYMDMTNEWPIDKIEKIFNFLDDLVLRINLIIEQNSKLSDEEFLKFIGNLPEKYSKIKNLDGTQTVLENNNYNKNLIDILKDRKFITSSKKCGKDNIRLYIKDYTN
ncbi:hypothetical protein O6B97_08670 [Campylobacter ureolyticus]|uniref:YobI family P-loop NTPase n=1 Tax=Campylobacter ureolyticus TaxID=827 RepID=UPI0022B54E44|nr:hypothetical protein [Campylobacter ureolyticus]MCZ6175075.1 hypothetical protein [Campylobacter ureolyticus]MCZ6187158.1 hypothetical protein [Campylobacter ureolyticus]